MSVAVENLGYEQIIALRAIREAPDLEGAEICKKAGCSYGEMFGLAQAGLIDLGAGRLKPKQLHPTLTAEGAAALLEAEREGII